MPNADLFQPRPILTSAKLLATTLDDLRTRSRTPGDVWRLLTESYTVDLDAVAKILPVSEPEPIWLSARD